MIAKSKPYTDNEILSCLRKSVFTFNPHATGEGDVALVEDWEKVIKELHEKL